MDMQSANVNNTRALADFSAAVATFNTHARAALSSVERELQRAQDWLEEQRRHWAFLERKAEEAFIHAKLELARRKMMRIGERPVATSDQEQAFHKAKARFEHVQEKHRRTREWQRVLPQMVLDEQTPVKVLQNQLEADLPRMRAFLEEKLSDLERYTQEQP